MPFYDHYAGRKRNSYGEKVKKIFADKLFGLSIEGFKSAPRILEIGPGDGYIAGLAKENGNEYLGIEGSPKVFENLISKGYNIIKSFVPPLPDKLVNMIFVLLYILLNI